MSSLTRLALALAALLAWACTKPAPGADAETALIAGEDSLRARYVRQFTCPASVPREWRRRDGVPLADWECSALVATAAALKRAEAQPGYVRDWARLPLRCAHVIAFRYPELRPDGTFSPLQGYWSVEFLNSRAQGARGIVYVPSGTLEVQPLNNEFVAPLEELCRAGL
ncbi:hypothetical protein [Gemmatimonas phototrophica]|uniref:Lipoprotein n=1 Tax=Gemmatimonas phototrophica TaxID=1379270 RepID=A0A143BFE1_9BACT|nr:hypothetical protein [Gemmatimonas phototrophica]AMW03727.1 hypothetical protein GEMMAAP_00445 [Gemmatimonas phototrophica]